MKTKILFARQKIIGIILCIVFFMNSGCGNQQSVSLENIDCIEELGWAVKLTLKTQSDENYLATEAPEIMTLVAKHDVIFYQTWPDPKAPRELLLLYTLAGKGYDKENKENIISDFLATGKFEDEVFEYGISHTNN